jgi:hypothetical protein
MESSSHHTADRARCVRRSCWAPARSWRSGSARVPGRGAVAAELVPARTKRTPPLTTAGHPHPGRVRRSPSGPRRPRRSRAGVELLEPALTTAHELGMRPARDARPTPAGVHRHGTHGRRRHRRAAARGRGVGDRASRRGRSPARQQRPAPPRAAAGGAAAPSSSPGRRTGPRASRPPPTPRSTSAATRTTTPACCSTCKRRPPTGGGSLTSRTSSTRPSAGTTASAPHAPNSRSTPSPSSWPLRSGSAAATGAPRPTPNAPA